MGFAPSAITGTNIVVAGKPVLGGEKILKVSQGRIREIGRFTISTTNTGTWAADAVNTLAAAGEDLVGVILTPTGVAAAANIVLTLSGQDNVPANITAVCTFAPPAWCRIQAKTFPIGWGEDCIEASSKKLATISGATIVCGADTAGTIIGIYAIPELTTFTEIMCAEDVDWDTQAPESVSIACGMDGTAFSKPGRSGERSMRATTHLVSSAESMMRFDGMTVTALVELRKEGKVVTDRYFLQDWQVKAKPTLPSGNTPASAAGEGKYQLCISMIAG